MIFVIIFSLSLFMYFLSWARTREFSSSVARQWPWHRPWPCARVYKRGIVHFISKYLPFVSVIFHRGSPSNQPPKFLFQLKSQSLLSFTKQRSLPELNLTGFWVGKFQFNLVLRYLYHYTIVSLAICRRLKLDFVGSRVVFRLVYVAVAHLI